MLFQISKGKCESQFGSVGVGMGIGNYNIFLALYFSVTFPGLHL